MWGASLLVGHEAVLPESLPIATHQGSQWWPQIDVSLRDPEHQSQKRSSPPKYSRLKSSFSTSVPDETIQYRALGTCGPVEHQFLICKRIVTFSAQVLTPGRSRVSISALNWTIQSIRVMGCRSDVQTFKP